jgi:hypothetical protein
MLLESGVDDGHAPERPPTFEDGQDIRDRAFEYACRVVRFCQLLSDAGGVGRLMVPQLLSCSLSFATMLVQEGNELIAIVTTIIKNKRKSVAAKRAAAKRDRRARAAKPQARGYEFQIPNS